MFEPILQYVSRYIELTPEEEEYFASILKTKLIRKKQYLLQAGDVCKAETFVTKGCLRAYFVDPSGHEHIVQFAIENWWISDLASLTSGQPAQLNIDALEETEVILIEIDKLNELYSKIPKFNLMFRQMFQQTFIAHQQRILDNLCKPAKERYISFLKKYRNIDQRIPQTQIASYLGITPEFLSQIRKQLAQSSDNS